MTERASERGQASKLRDALARVNPDDIRLDSEGRVVISNPEIAAQLKDLGPVASELAARKRDDTNIICCGNGTCRGGEDLGALVERFTAGRMIP